MISESREQQVVHSCVVLTEMALSALAAVNVAATPIGSSSILQRTQDLIQRCLGPSASRLPVQELAIAAPMALTAIVVLGLHFAYDFLADQSRVYQRPM